jgi:hypothetical protein
MSQRASLGVLIPTRNSAELLPGHLDSLEAWLDLADEVVVVDSFSTDGTQEMLRRNLRHSNLLLLSHPPGLYASWNAGVVQITAQYTYIATVGDTITRTGIQRLLETARSLDADVVISKPVFRKPQGGLGHIHWPIDEMVQMFRITAPRRLQRLEILVFAHATDALTGSCASDLFCTAALKRFPFPTEFGTAGDGFWGLQHAAQLTWAVVPGNFSAFLLHPAAASQAENPPQPGAPRADEVLRTALSTWIREGLVREQELARLGWRELETAFSGYLDAKGRYDLYRKRPLPWFLNARAWQARTCRDRWLARLHAAKELASRQVASSGAPKRVDRATGDGGL